MLCIISTICLMTVYKSYIPLVDLYDKKLFFTVKLLHVYLCQTGIVASINCIEMVEDLAANIKTLFSLHRTYTYLVTLYHQDGAWYLGELSPPSSLKVLKISCHLPFDISLLCCYFSEFESSHFKAI